MGRHKKQTILTQEQIDFRNNILRGNLRVVKNGDKFPAQKNPFRSETEPKPSNEDEIQKCFFFINNCIFWINEYVDGNENKSRLLQTAKALQENARKLEMLLR